MSEAESRRVERTPDKLGDTPVSRGTRIPVYIFIDCLKEGCGAQGFLSQYDISPDLV